MKESKAKENKTVSETQEIVRFITGQYYPRVMIPPHFKPATAKDFIDKLEKAYKKECERVRREPKNEGLY